jgi:uncharacterized protein (TIGR02271 family)
MTSDMSSQPLSPRRLVTAFFDSRSDAEQALKRLTNAGVPRSSIRLMPGDERDPPDDPDTSPRTEPRGLWDSFGDWLLPDEDRHTYAEGLRRGGYLISVSASDEYYARVTAILYDEGTIDIDERAESWRSEGWTDWSGTGAGASSGIGSVSGRMTGASPTYDFSEDARSSDDKALISDAGSTTSVAPVSGDGRATDLSTDVSATMNSRGEQVIPVAQERLQVGKRDVSHGRVRIRSYVVETPVEEQVTLREERVAVERRSVDRALGDDEQAFQERTIEAEERGEEAVVSKEVRVTEEVVVRKEIDQRTETVSDTVRQTEVEVEDERGNRISGIGTTDRT